MRSFNMEIWDAYYQDGTLANIDLIRGEPIPNGLYHLVCEVIVRHLDGDYLLMQRDWSKPNYGGYFEATAGGSALKGEDKLTCIKRELLEETGILEDTFYEIGRDLSNTCIYYTFLCVTSCKKDSITLQEGETIAYKWISEQEFIDFIHSEQMIDTRQKRFLEYFSKMNYL